jgi:hypothetical protein
MRAREATVHAGARYTLPSASVVDVREIDHDKLHAQCHYVGFDGLSTVGRPSAPPDVTLTLRFLQKFARRVWT